MKDHLKQAAFVLAVIAVTRVVARTMGVQPGVGLGDYLPL